MSEYIFEIDGALFNEKTGEAVMKPKFVGRLTRCKDCKHFELDHPYIIQGVPVLGHEVCTAWGDGCKTTEDGYCFLAERRKDGTTN